MKRTLINTIEPHPAFAGCGAPPKPAARRPLDAPPVFVNGVEIPEAAIAREAQNHAAASGPEARAAAARALAIRELLLQRARALALEPAPRDDADGRAETDEEALVRQVLEREVVPAAPSEDECRRVYAASPKRFETPELYEAAHILISPAGADERAWTDARAAAAALIATLRKAGGDFAQLAREHSACPSSRQGGSLGLLQRGDLAPEIEAALAALSPGEVAAAPVRTRHGWHVLRLDRRLPSEPIPFDAAAPKISAALRARAWTAAAARYIEGLTREACIDGLSLWERAGVRMDLKNDGRL